MPIRVLRLIEYVYDTPDEAQKDMERWGVPANGSYSPNPSKSIRSAIISDLNWHPSPRMYTVFVTKEEEDDDHTEHTVDCELGLGQDYCVGHE